MAKTELMQADITCAADLMKFLKECEQHVDLTVVYVSNEGHNDHVHGAYLMESTLTDGSVVHDIELWA